MKSRLVLFTALVTAVVWAQALFNMHDRRGSIIHEAERDVSTLARTLEIQALDSINATDLLLRLVIQEMRERGWTSAPEQAQIQAYFHDVKAELPQLSNLILIDATGRFAAQAIGPIPPGIDARDREYFEILRQNPEMEKLISHGFYSRLSRKLVFGVSRQIRDAAGNFAGVLVATMDPQYYSGIYASLDVGRDGVIALFDSRGILIERHPNPEGTVGRSIADRPLFTEHLPRAPIGTFISTQQRDGHPRIAGYRWVDGTPLIITVSKSMSETLAPWREQAWREGAAIVLITILLVLGCGFILRESARRQESQKSLAESEQLFHSTFDQAPIGIAQINLDGSWRLTNSALCDILGYTEAELHQINFIELAEPEDVADCHAAWEAMISGNLEVYSAERRYQHKDGRIVWGSLTASLQRNMSGEPDYVLGILADMTSRKAAEADLIARSEQLRNSEENSLQQALILRSVIASMADAVMVADEHRRFVLFNPAARALFGEPPAKTFDPSDCVSLFGLYRADGQTPLPTEEVPLGRALRGEHIDSAEIYVRNAVMTDGAFISASARPMLDEAGVIRGAVVVCRNITEARLTSEALRQAQKMEAVGQLTGGIAHDFNNLLQVIMGNSEILSAALKGNKPHRKLAQMTLTAAQRGADLTSQLLSFSRRQILQPQPTDVRRLIADIEGLLSGAAGATISLKREFSRDLWLTVVDSGMLQNALVNIVLNARDAMPDGGRITIKAINFTCDPAYASRHHEVRSGDYVRITVSDTGIGIPAANLDKVFDPFFTTKDVGKGSGLGLSMVYGFVQQSGGAVRIRSTEGGGTVVKLYLPRARISSATVTAHDKSAPLGSETILVVEDDPMVRDYVVGTLRSLGYSVVATTDGATALQCLKAYEAPVHLLFSDIVMPGGMTGWELAEHAGVLRPALKVLLTSGYAETTYPPGVTKTGRHTLLAKPYTKSALARAVRTALAGDTVTVAD